MVVGVNKKQAEIIHQPFFLGIAVSKDFPQMLCVAKTYALIYYVGH
jgi:hypothetical protein